MNDISIEQIRHELTWKLRQKVLYPQEELSQMRMDEDLDGVHFAAFKDGYIVAVVSLFQNESIFQFRKFAVEPAVQNMGIGSEVLNYITNFAVHEGGILLWCNARITAIPFYLKHGFTKTGKMFSKNGFDYEILEKILA